jgi:hypothetical protein
LTRRISSVPISSDPIFPSPRGDVRQARNLLREAKAVLMRAGIDPRAGHRGRTLDVHALRSTATTRKHYTDLRIHDTRAAIDDLPAPKAPEDAAERSKAAVGGAEPATIRRPGANGAVSNEDAAEAQAPAAQIVSFKSGREDLNLRPSAPKTDALPG